MRTVTFFQFIPAGPIIFLCVQVKLLFLALFREREREGGGLCNSVKHINDENEEHKEKRGGKQLIRSHCVNTFINMDAQNVEVPGCNCHVHLFLSLSFVQSVLEQIHL